MSNHIPMEQNQELLDAARVRVREYLNEIHPDYVEFEDGRFTVQEGSATISITIRPWHEGDSAVEFTSQLVTGGTIDEKVMRWLLEKNVELHFGALGLLFDDTIVYSHTLPGCDLSRKEFEATIRTVSMIADHYDDELMAMTGGTNGPAAVEQVAAELGKS
jgi:hypothetical protein